MAIEREDTLIHWNYFLALEEDLERLARFVDLSANDATFSLEIARLFLSACAEIDVVMKQLAKRYDATSQAASINVYFPVVSTGLPRFKRFVAEIPRHKVTLRPWDSWDASNPPFWWQDHNKVKHHRHEHFASANLKNCLNSVAALYCATLHLYADQAEAGSLATVPRLFVAGQEHAAGTRMHGTGISLVYKGLTPSG
jgi:hypothetical protein